MLPLLGLLATIKGALFELVIGSGLGVLQALLEQEREQIYGARSKVPGSLARFPLPSRG